MTVAAMLTPDLHAYLLLQITIEARDEEATRQALRHAATALPEQQGHKVVGILSRTLPGKSRNWLSRL